MPRKTLIEPYPIVAFVLLVFVLPSPILLLRFLSLPFEPILIYASWTPNIAAFIVVRLILREEGGIRRLLGGWRKWRAKPAWYLAALSPFFVAFLAAGTYLVLGGTPDPPEQSLGVPLFTSFVLSLITGATGEELGWRGFLLPRLQRRCNALISSLIVGVIWALWHVPLWLLPGYGWESIPYWAFALGAVSSSVIFTWVVNNTGGSMVMASLVHLTMNYGMSVVGMVGLLPSPGDGWTIASIIFALYAIVVTLVAGPSGLSGQKIPGAAPD